MNTIHGFQFSPNQLTKMKRAYKNGGTVTLGLKNNQLKGPHKVQLDNAQIKRVQKASRSGSGCRIHISKNTLEGSGLLTKLMDSKLARSAVNRGVDFAGKQVKKGYNEKVNQRKLSGKGCSSQEGGALLSGLLKALGGIFVKDVKNQFDGTYKPMSLRKGKGVEVDNDAELKGMEIAAKLRMNQPIENDITTMVGNGLMGGSFFKSFLKGFKRGFLTPISGIRDIVNYAQGNGIGDHLSAGGITGFGHPCTCHGGCLNKCGPVESYEENTTGNGIKFY